jgi:hypothetical protein
MRRKMKKKLINEYVLLACIILFVGICAFFIKLGVSYLKENLKCANTISCIKDLSGKYEKTNVGSYMGETIVGPVENMKPDVRVLGDTSGVDKHIYVDLTNQYLYATENGNTVFGFPISSGLTNPTPTGDFHIWIKLKYTRMKGGIGRTYYNLPNVPYTMYFYNDQVPKSMGYGLHGAYWHNNFGHPMSHGCVNISPENAKILYDWANPATAGSVTRATDDNEGTAITIFGVTPRS